MLQKKEELGLKIKKSNGVFSKWSLPFGCSMGDSVYFDTAKLSRDGWCTIETLEDWLVG